MTPDQIRQAIAGGRAEIIPCPVYHVARQSYGKPARLTLAVNDDLIKRLVNQASDRDIFALVRVPAEVKRAAEAGILLPGVK
jgi:hypothetical protein